MSKQQIINELRSKRDALSLYHCQLKKNSDDWNKCIIVLSLLAGFVETAKIQLALQTDFWKLLPIAINTLIAICSSLIKFRDYPQRQEVVLGARDTLSHFLTKIRGLPGDLGESELREFYTCLEFLETCITPAERKTFVKNAQSILLRIQRNEHQFLELLNDPTHPLPEGSDASPDENSERGLSITRNL